MAGTPLHAALTPDTTTSPSPPHLVEGAVTQGWKPAMAALLIAFGDRLEPYLQ